MKTWKALGIAVAVLAIIGVTYIPFGSAEEGKSIEQMIAEAKTPADHEAIAAYYEKQAQAAHQEHAEHQQLSSEYAKVPVLKTKTGAVAHCNTISKNYENIAKEYEALAKLHQGMAKPAK